MKAPKTILTAAAAAAICCASGASQAATANQAATAAATAHTATTHLVAWSVNSDGPRLRAALTGAAGDYGAAIRQGDTGQASELQLKLSRGSFGLSAAKINARLAKALKNWRYDQATCSVHVTASGPAQVIAGSGTGAYRGITGAFTLTITIDEVDARQPGCSGHLVNGKPAYVSQLSVIQGTGAISVGSQS